jgi:hypothetical protein
MRYFVKFFITSDNLLLQNIIKEVLQIDFLAAPKFRGLGWLKSCPAVYLRDNFLTIPNNFFIALALLPGWLQEPVRVLLRLQRSG